MAASTRWKNRPEGSTWGDFGPDDQLGRLNLVTREKVLQGIAEVREGRAFCLSLPLEVPGGQTMNPWLLEEGASGSSAGPGAATAAGLVGFSVGSETGGSIISPSMRCGVTGLRPTYDERLGISREEFQSYLVFQEKLVPSGKTVKVTLVSAEPYHS